MKKAILLISLLNVVCEMAPYLLLGFLIAGILHVFVPQDFYRKYLSKDNKLAVLWAALLLGALPLIACKSQHVNDEPAKYDTTTDVNLVLEELKGRDVVLFVADQDEISPAEVPFPVVFTGMGKMRMFSALVKWHETLPEGSHPVVLNIGSAGSAKYPIGTIVNCPRIFNGLKVIFPCTRQMPWRACFPCR